MLCKLPYSKAGLHEVENHTKPGLAVGKMCKHCPDGSLWCCKLHCWLDKYCVIFYSYYHLVTHKKTWSRATNVSCKSHWYCFCILSAQSTSQLTQNISYTLGWIGPMSSQYIALAFSPPYTNFCFKSSLQAVIVPNHEQQPVVVTWCRYHQIL